ncbi:O-antigen ligase [Desulfitobacterium sp. PCE1]|uniref:O-antigen ligase family protein n=1 Tax=Desulfitobacterium sp. PCE1 TaxID=146907 RepID=UPI0003603173|nr:O-antigen ligase family protein [Desulfitobacterium sp. PCE1]
MGKNKEAKWHHFLPLMFVVALLPLIVYLKVMPLEGASYDYWVGTMENYDFFSYYKGIGLLIAASFSMAILLIRVFQSKQNLLNQDFKPYYIALGVYVLLIIGSTLTSEYLAVSLTGFPDRYEGLYVLIAYTVLFFATTALVTRENHVKYLVNSLLVGALLLSVIGLLQFVGLDIFKTGLGKSLILPGEYMSIADELEFSFDKYTIYATLFHYNYVGSYGALVFPLCLALFILSGDKPFKVAMAGMTGLLGIMVIGSNARSGIVGVALALVVLLICLNKIILKYKKTAALSLVLLLGIFLGLNQLSGGFIESRISSLITDAKVLLGVEERVEPGAESIPLKEVTIDGTHCSVITATETLSFDFKNGALSFFDENNDRIEAFFENNKIQFLDDAYQDYNLTFGNFNDQLSMQLIKGDIFLMFALEPDKVALIDNKGNEVSMEPVEAWGFEGHERLGSSRGYIWSRSLPLLKDTLILGTGPDTFAIAFPQHDITGKMYAYGNMWEIVDKPHNLYLQIAINTGVVSLLAFLFLVGYYIYRSFRLYLFNSFDTSLAQVGVGVFAGIVGYLGAGVFNDSVVSVAPVFWCLLGLGVSINHMISREKKAVA